MSFFSNISIRKKMLIIITGISSLTIILAMAFNLFQNIQLFKEDIKNNALLNAKITSEYCAASLLFEYNDEAANNLDKLKSIPNILNACLFNKDGEIFAEFTRNGESKITYPRPEKDTYRFEDNYLHVFQSVEYMGSMYGTLYLRISTAELTAKIYELIGLLAIMSLILLTLAYLLANKFQKIITKPILDLASVTNNLSSTNDFSQRVTPEGKDEISTLYSGFNNMLEQIESRDKKINETLYALTESEERYKLAVSAGKVGVWEWEIGSDKTFCGESIMKLLGYDEKEMSDGYLRLEDFVYDDDITLVKNERQNYLNGQKENYELEYRAKKKDGSILWFISKGQYHKNEKNEIVKIVGTDTDITQKKIAEKMEKEMHLAEEANKAKSEFLARMSHEIRTPMNAIIGLSFMALKTKLTEKQHDYLDKINKSANSLLGIINDILDFSKIEAGKLDVEEINFNLDEVFSDLTNIISAKAHDKKLEFLFGFTNDIPLNLVGDPLRLRQILINLCNNAIKFTEEGTVSVIIEKTEEDIKKVKLLFKIIDTGIGIKEDKLNKLFKSFSQIDTSTTREYGGTGLGLVISQRLIELMGGNINVESEYGKGTTFSFNLSFDKQGDVRKKEFNLSSELQKMHVLICDDNKISLELLTKMLMSFRLKVTSVNSGTEAEKVMREKNTDPIKLAIIDWMMPHQDGMTTIKNIKSDNTIPEKPKFILMTAFGLEEVKEQANEIEIDNFLIKPITYSTLFDSIMEIFGKSKKAGYPPQNEKDNSITVLNDIKGASILLTEDNQINQQVASELLESFGMRVEVANNGEEAVNMFKDENYNNNFDLVLMDIQMPVMDGYEATENLRKLDAAKNIPIVAMTADAVTGVKEKCLSIGMNDYITKPINANELAGVINKWLEGKVKIIPNEKTSKTETDEIDNKEIIIPELTGVDTNDGLHRVAGNKTLYLNLLQKFHDNSSDIVNQINNAYTDGDSELVHRLIHTLKGVSGNLGMQNLFETAKNIEQEIKNEGVQQLPQKLDEISKILDPILYDIGTKLFKTDSGLSEDLDREEYLELLKKLEAMIIDYNADALSIIDKIKYDNHLTELKLLKEKLQQYDFDSALEIVKGIIKTCEKTIA